VSTDQLIPTLTKLHLQHMKKLLKENHIFRLQVIHIILLLMGGLQPLFLRHQCIRQVHALGKLIPEEHRLFKKTRNFRATRL
jgi:hypothetical protein